MRIFLEIDRNRDVPVSNEFMLYERPRRKGSLRAIHGRTRCLSISCLVRLAKSRSKPTDNTLS